MKPKSKFPGSKSTSISGMTLADIQAVYALELESYEFPWTKRIFQDCIKAQHLCFVMMSENKIIGYVVVSVGAGEAHILNLCIEKQFRGLGHGREFLNYVIKTVGDEGVESIFLEVRESNRSARFLYESIGFNEIGIREAYYPAAKGKENALVFAYTVIAV